MSSRVSYSQYGMWSSCPHQFKLNYIDKLGKYESNIHLIFGSSMHEVIQDFLTVMYTKTKKEAVAMDLEDLLKNKLIEHFGIEQKKMNGKIPCTKEELEEFYGDGRRILQYLLNKLTKFYPKTGYELVGIEIRLEEDIKTGVKFIGFIDVVLKDKIADSIIIIDLKTSTCGWSKYQKNDKIKTSQMLLYKKFYSEKFDVPLDKIKVEYQILKRKVSTYYEYPIPRISRFIPANGKPSINKAWRGFMEFVDFVYDDDGNLNDREYPLKVGRNCDWCVFKTSHDCPHWK